MVGAVKHAPDDKTAITAEESALAAARQGNGQAYGEYILDSVKLAFVCIHFLRLLNLLLPLLRRATWRALPSPRKPQHACQLYCVARGAQRGAAAFCNSIAAAIARAVTMARIAAARLVA